MIVPFYSLDIFHLSPLLTILVFVYLQRIAVEEMSTEEICGELEKRGFTKTKAVSPPDVNDEL